jgi:uncharacterized membrane protein
MDSSVVIGAALYLLGAACVVVQVRWTRADKRAWEEAAKAAEEAGEEPPPPPPDPWRRLPVQERL